MARKVEQMPSPPGSGSPKWPWDEWLDGDAWELIPAEDFPDANPTSMRTQLHSAAEKRGKKVSVQMRGDRMFVQARDRP